MLFLFYSLVGGYACISGVLWAMPALRRQRWFGFLSVCPCLCFYFLPVLIYGVYRLKLGNWTEMRLHLSHDQARMISLIQEPVELGLAAGFLLITAAAWQRVTREN
jgi:ABC-type Fe3+ transport system permease subunit